MYSRPPGSSGGPMNRYLNRLHGGWKIGPLTLWTAMRTGPRVYFEDFRKHGGNALSLTIAPFPDRHSNFNVQFYLRVRR